MHPSVHKILQISQIRGLGVASYWRLIEAFGGVEQICGASHQALSAHVSNTLASKIVTLSESVPDSFSAETIAWCEANDVHLISHSDEEYPSQLREIKRGPPLIYIKGDPTCLGESQIAIVGSRSSSHTGKKNAFTMSKCLAKHGLVITSGLALGIDTQAHRGALEAGGKTIAVVGSGIDIVYPQRNRALTEEILATGGTIVSEFPLRTAPTPANFPRRNRIISGLSVGTLVIEAAMKSGSLITARYALEQNREVFAMPGSVHNPLSRGCHVLIKQGAVLVENADDVMNELKGFVALRISDKGQNTSGVQAKLSDDEFAVLRCVEYDLLSLDELAGKSGIETAKLLANLISLELMGLVSCESGRYSRLGDTVASAS